MYHVYRIWLDKSTIVNIRIGVFSSNILILYTISVVFLCVYIVCNVQYTAYTIRLIYSIRKLLCLPEELEGAVIVKSVDNARTMHIKMCSLYDLLRYKSDPPLMSVYENRYVIISQANRIFEGVNDFHELQAKMQYTGNLYYPVYM